MKKSKIFFAIVAGIMSATLLAGCNCAGFGDSTGGSSGGSTGGSSQGSTQGSTGGSSQGSTGGSSQGSTGGSQGGEQTPTYGLPVAAVGHYIKDADVLDDTDARYLVYTTNEESAEEDNVIAVRTGAYDETNGWAYGAENIVVRGEAGEWDEYIGSASVVKGVFEYSDVNYNWLMAYCATTQVNETQYEIGLAVATEIGGTWVKVGEKALIEFDEAVYGSGSVGCYAPSLVSLDKQSKVRIYYTYADAYGHLARYVDINAADVDALYGADAATDVNLISGFAYLPVNGNLQGGDAEMQMPNGDFAHDATSGKVIMVKDVSPSAANTPKYAISIQLAYIAETELYTVEEGTGWVSERVWDSMDTPNFAYERLYSACVVADVYGHVDGATAAEIIYNVCDVEQVNANWMFTQNLLSFEQTFAA